jgi:hypothetical protein
MTAGGSRRTWRERAHDEDGLIGKILLAFLVIVVVLAVAAVDAGSIALSRVRTADLAQNAATAAADRFQQTHSRREAVRAALAAIADRDDNARMRDLTVASDGAVTVTVSDRAWTLVAGRLPFLDDLTTTTATQTHTPG